MADERVISPEDRFAGEHVTLRLVTPDDCTERYVEWLRDPEVNRYLETRWDTQTLASVCAFVEEMSSGPANYLFAIVDNSTGEHVGNIKIGPIDPHHGHADVGYFIGDRSVWGRGYVSEAIGLAARVAFDRLGLRRLQAGVYEGNIASARALEKAGFHLEARFDDQVLGPDGYEDHLFYVRFRDAG